MGFNKMKHLNWIVIAVLLLLTSCSFIVNRMVGIRTVKTMDDKAITAAAIQFEIPLKHVYAVDTNYIQVLKAKQQKHTPTSLNNHLQPLQALYFINGQYPESFQINCYAGGLPNLNWERDGIMESFPPKIQAPLDSMVSREELFNIVQKLNGVDYSEAITSGPLVVVFWTKFMHKHTKAFIPVVQKNLKHSTVPVQVIYVNADNLFAHLEE